MLKLSVCLLTCNSARLLMEVLPPLLRVADECIVVDSGSTDETVSICQQFGLTVHRHAYKAHGAQMNYAIGLPAMTGCCAWTAMKFLITTSCRPFRR